MIGVGDWGFATPTNATVNRNRIEYRNIDLLWRWRRFVFSPGSAHKNSRNPDAFADVCYFLVELALIVGDLRLLLFQGIHRSDKLRRGVLGSHRPNKGASDC